MLRRPAHSLFILAATLGAIAHSAPAADTQPADPTLQTAQQIIRKALAAARAGPLQASADATELFVCLARDQDPELLPIFQKLRDTSFPTNQVIAMSVFAATTKDP